MSKNKLSIKIKTTLIKKIKNNSINKCNLIIVIGGDGFMLQTLKKNKNSKKLFYGVNSGNYGFLMNKFSSKSFVKNFTYFPCSIINISINTHEIH